MTAVDDATLTIDVPQGRYFRGTGGFLAPMTTYAQNSEDVTLRRALQDIKEGFWVDIGANHPIIESVTKWFSEQGWHGINVEPNPAFLTLLQAERPRDINLGIAIGAHRGRVPLHILGNTGQTTTIYRFAEREAQNGQPITSTIEVDMLPLDALLDTHAKDRTVDFLKIDAEGAEPDIIGAAAFDRHRPRIILFENIDGYEPPLPSKGYHYVWYDGLNHFYVRDEDLWRADLLARPPSVWDQAAGMDSRRGVSPTQGT